MKAVLVSTPLEWTDWGSLLIFYRCQKGWLAEALLPAGGDEEILVGLCACLLVFASVLPVVVWTD